MAASVTTETLSATTRTKPLSMARRVTLPSTVRMTSPAAMTAVMGWWPGKMPMLPNAVGRVTLSAVPS